MIYHDLHGKLRGSNVCEIRESLSNCQRQFYGKLTLAAATLFSAETPSSSTRALAAVAALCSLYETSPACKALISALFAVAFSALKPSVTTCNSNESKINKCPCYSKIG